MLPLLIAPFASTAAAMIILALVFLVLVGAVIILDTPAAKRYLRQQAWYRRFEQLPPRELRFRGLVSIGVGMCSFATLLTLKLLFPATSWITALSFGILTVVAVTLGAALLERAAMLDP